MISRLKSMELHGYKTFASRTLFEFPGTTTAIVGPNGSGKSNIADSIRWVLGEQSYSLLRGRKTEDMIFAGSELRPRASMASAMIVFDNEDGWLPIDYSEVSIARRAYRDGQNEYLLNGQRVRLKEISELLGQSGLAERTYTIIGQGLVDAALSLKPEERRKFFEEAAGIGLYRSRREESLNRLENTRRNLERVQDILSELEPRLKSLEKQAARAIEYDRIKADLRVLLREWYGFHWHRTQNDVAHARDVLRTQEDRLSQTREALEEVEIRVQSSREEVQLIRQELNDWHNQSAGLHNQREKISRTLAVLDERQRALLEQQVTFQSDLSRLEDEETAHKERLENALTEQKQLEESVNEADLQVEMAKKALQERQSKREKLIGVLKSLRSQLNRSETRQVELRAHQKELTVRRENLTRDVTRLEEGQAAAQQALQNAEKQHSQAMDEQQSGEKARTQLTEAVQAIQAEANRLDDERRKLQNQIAQVESERARSKAQLDVLEQAERSLNGLNQGSKSILQAARDGKLRGSFQAVSSLLDVPAEYEVAVAAALGEYLDGISLDGESDLDSVLAHLEKSNSGRAILFPAAGLRPVSERPNYAATECIGIAAELVKAAAAVKPVVDLLLGQVILVEDRRVAQAVAADQPAHVRVVTLKGEVFYGSGMVAAGQEGRSSIIARPRQIRELQTRLEALGVQLQDLKTKERETVEAWEHQQTERKSKEKELRELVQKIDLFDRHMREATLQVQQARQKLTWQQDQVKTLTGQIEQAKKEIGTISTDMRKLEDEQESLDLQINEQQAALDLLPTEGHQAQVVHWNTQAALAERSLNDLNQRITEYKRTFDNNQTQQTTLRQRLVQIQGNLDQIDLEKQQSRVQENGLNDQMEALRVKIDPGEIKLTALEAHYEKMLGDQTAAQQSVNVAERYVTQSQLELGRLQDAMDSLRRRIEEDFGLVAFEYRADISGPTPLPLDGMVQELPALVEIPPELEDTINRLRGQLRRIGAINPDAQSEYYSVKERFEFLNTQVVDLKKADEDLRVVIADLDELMKREFRKTFDAVAAEFKIMFTRLFGGGSARLVLNDEDNPTEAGIDIEARLPGRREQGLSLLSGGERSLTAVALVFSLLKISPTPFCIMDEVDAMLDEANVGRFCDLLRELSQTTQFILITHNRNTVQVADVIYGVTMGKDTASQVISLRLDEVSEDLVKG